MKVHENCLPLRNEELVAPLVGAQSIIIYYLSNDMSRPLFRLYITRKLVSILLLQIRFTETRYVWKLAVLTKYENTCDKTTASVGALLHCNLY